MQNVKRAYVAPAMSKIGSFEEITQASQAGPRTDVALAAGASTAGHLQLS